MLVEEDVLVEEESTTLCKEMAEVNEQIEQANEQIDRQGKQIDRQGKQIVQELLQIIEARGRLLFDLGHPQHHHRLIRLESNENKTVKDTKQFSKNCYRLFKQVIDFFLISVILNHHRLLLRKLFEHVIVFC
jgi:hypothetical protein